MITIDGEDFFRGGVIPLREDCVINDFSLTRESKARLSELTIERICGGLTVHYFVLKTALTKNQSHYQ